MKLERLRSLSLRHTLLLVLLPGMLLVLGSELWLTWRTAVGAATAAYDRSLLGAMKSIDANISTDSGGIGVELPYRMLEFFELTANGKVFYRVATEDGLVEIGNADLPLPPEELLTGKPTFTDSTYFGEPVRIGTIARVLNPPLADQSGAERVVIQVAETLESRNEFLHALVAKSVARDVMLVLAVSVLLALVLAWSLRPLARLRNDVQSRSAQDLTPIVTTGVPADLQPLVEAINFHVARNHRLTEARRRFIDDASHQLRTPLTTLITQVGFALRADDTAQMREALLAIHAQLDEAVRQTNQMLMLALTDAAEVELVPVDLAPLAEAAAREWWPAAREHGIDLGYERCACAAPVKAHPALLKEALSNLLHNAVRYVPRGGQVTVRVEALAGHATLTVIDNGPGIPPEEQPRAGERFFRGSNVSQPGSGLGLAIVRSIAERNGGELRLAQGSDGRGLAASIVLPSMAAG